ncbi:MAG: hypothetical protein ACI9WU_001714 [Myxococcota bacterium]|jgi:hypothetical protein
MVVLQVDPFWPTSKTSVNEPDSDIPSIAPVPVTAHGHHRVPRDG